MKLLIIGQGESIHTVKFLNALRRFADPGAVVFYPSTPLPISGAVMQLADVPTRNSFEGRIPAALYWHSVLRKARSPYSGDAESLKSLVDEFNPTHIHINCIQDAGYLLLDAIRLGLSLKGRRVSLSIWGNDLYLFQHEASHRALITEFLRHVDVILPESSRDVWLARQFGYVGLFSALIQATFFCKGDIRVDANLDRKRNLFIFKSDRASGRSFSLTALEAFRTRAERSSELIEVLFLNPNIFEERALSNLRQLPNVQVVTAGNIQQESYFDILSSAKALFSITLSDGVPNSFLEALSLNVIPVFSKYAALGDWCDIATFFQVDPLDSVDVCRVVDRVFNLNDEQLSAITSRNAAALEVYNENYVSKVIRSVFC
jgi:hypothetical protein